MQHTISGSLARNVKCHHDKLAGSVRSPRVAPVPQEIDMDSLVRCSRIEKSIFPVQIVAVTSGYNRQTCDNNLWKSFNLKSDEAKVTPRFQMHAPRCCADHAWTSRRSAYRYAQVLNARSRPTSRRSTTALEFAQRILRLLSLSPRLDMLARD